jgi:hypothetical protein
MIWKQCPCIDVHRIIFYQLGQATKEILPVFVVEKYLFSFNTPAHDMMQGTRGLPAIARPGEAGGHPILLTVAWFSALVLDSLVSSNFCTNVPFNVPFNHEDGGGITRQQKVHSVLGIG